MRRAVLARLSLLFAFLFATTLLSFGQGSKLKVTDQGGEIEEQDDPLARQIWFLQGRLSPDGTPAATWLTRAYSQKMQMRANFANRLHAMQISGTTPSATIPVAGGTAVWAPMGPGPMVDDGLVGQNYGPNVGRITGVAVNPADATGNTVVIGAAYGGAWISFNAAATDPTKVFWQPLSDQLATLATGSVSFSPNGTVLLVGSGEGNSAIDSYYGLGIFRSINGGQSFTQITSSADGHSFLGLGMQRQAWSTQNTNVVAIAMTAASRSEGLFAGTSRQGLYYSTDAGATWNLANFFDTGVQITAAASSNSVVYNAADHHFYAHLRFHGIYRSTNVDDPSRFDRLTRQPDVSGTGIDLVTNCPVAADSTNCPIQRAELAAHPTRNEVYVWWIDNSGTTSRGFWKSLDGGATWTQLTDTNFLTCGDSFGGCGASQAFYNMKVLAVSNPTTSSQTDLYIGGVNQYKCTIDNSASNGNEKCANTTPDSPFTFKNLTHVYGCSVFGSISDVHPDQHDMAAALGTRIIYFGHDGGVSRTLDSSQLNTGVCDNTGNTKKNAYDNLNSNMGSVTQFLWGTPIPNDVMGIIAGSQDNGSAAVYAALTPTNGQTGVQINGGDGGYNDIDSASANTWYTANTGVTIQKSTSGTGSTRNSWSSIVTKSSVGSDTSAFYTPYMLDPLLTSKIIVGTCRVWRGPNTAWGTTLGSAISPKLVAGGTTACVSGDTNISSLATGGTLAAGVGSKVIYAGLSNGTVFMTSDSSVATPTWTNVSPTTTQTGNFPVFSIAVDKNDATGKTAYAAIQGFHVSHVLKTTTGGTSWTDISTGLPDAPANSVVIDPDDSNVLYVGTDVGVFSLDQSASSTWIEVGPASSSGTAGFIPNVPVYRIARQDLNSGAVKLLKAVTYGRGVWVADITSGTPALTVSPASPISFGSVSLNSSSTQTVTLTNSGTAAVTVSNAVLADQTNWDVNSISCGALPASVQAGGSCQLSITFQPTVGGVLNTTFTLTDNAGGHVINLNGSGTAPGPTFSASPNPVAFPNTTINTDSAPISVTITNGGGQPLSITSVTPLNMTEFVRQSGNCPTSTGSINAGASCTDVYIFHPANNTPQSGTLTYVTNASNSPNVVTFTGTTAIQTIGVAPLTVTFPVQRVGTTSATQNVTISASGGPDSHITAIATAAPFAVALNTCGPLPKTLTSGTNCVVQVSFTPTSVGAAPATNLSVTDDSGGTPGSIQNVALSGTGAVPAISAAAFDFGNVKVNATSTQNVTVNNTSQVPLVITAVAVTGSANLTVATGGTCTAALPTTVAGGSSCTVAVKFAPTATGAVAGALAVTSDTGGTAGTVTNSNVTGTGALGTATMSGGPLSFSGTALNTNSATRTLTLTNSGPVSTTITGITFTGTNASEFSQTNACNNTIAAGGNCVLTVTFKPAATGARTATISVAHDGTNSPSTTTLSGTGEDFAQSTGTSTATVTAGGSATFTMTETPAAGTFSNAITFSCTGLDSTMGCAFNPPQVTPGSSAATTALTITTRKASSAAPAIKGVAKNGTGLGTLAFLLALPGMAVFFPTVSNRKLGWKKKLGMLMLLLIVLTLILSMSGCSSGGGTPGTPAGTYNIGVVATSGSLSHTTTVTVTVQ